MELKNPSNPTASIDPADTLAYRVAAELLSQEGTGPAWNLEIEDARRGYARVAMTVRPDMLNGHRIAHGGMIFSLADSAFAYACNSYNEATVAQSASIVFMAPAREGEKLVAVAQERSRTGRSGVYAVTVYGEDGRVIAEFQGHSRTIGGAVIEP